MNCGTSRKSIARFKTKAIIFYIKTDGFDVCFEMVWMALFPELHNSTLVIGVLAKSTNAAYKSESCSLHSCSCLRGKHGHCSMTGMKGTLSFRSNTHDIDMYD